MNKMTERVSKEVDLMLNYAAKHKCCGRRFKRKIYRMLRMNAWDIKQQNTELKESEEHG